jgi:uncharacterized protein
MPLPAPNSPCINVCNLGPNGCCRGCYRTLEEIAQWTRLDAVRQWAVLHACEARRAATGPSAALEGA